MFFKDSTELLKALFPLPQEGLDQTVQLLNETQPDMEEFRLFFFWMLMGDGYRHIDLEYTGLVYYFYQFAVYKISHDLAPYVFDKPDLKVELSFMDYMHHNIKTLEEQQKIPLEERYKAPNWDEIEELEQEPYSSDDDEEEENEYDLFLDLQVNNKFEMPYFQLDNTGGFAIPFDERLKEFVQDFENFIGRVPEEKQTKLFKWLVNEVYEDFGREYGVKRKKPENQLKFKAMIPAMN